MGNDIERLAWTKNYIDNAIERAVENDQCEQYWNGNRQGEGKCSNKAKYITIFSEVNGAWAILTCPECSSRIRIGNDNPNSPDYDCDTAIVLIQPIDPRLTVLI